MLRKFLKKLFIIQEVSNIDRTKKSLPNLGRGFSTAIRFNPYNPLTYIALILIILIGILRVGYVGVFTETYQKNPFKWD